MDVDDEGDLERFKSRSQLVLPQHRLVLCTIAKVGYQNFNYMFNELNGFRAKDRHASTAENMGLEWDSITKENGWKFALFTRDPLERYVSAWGSKCLRDENGHLEDAGHRCAGEAVSEQQLDEEHVIQAFEKRVQTDLERGIPSGNGHWMTQTASATACDWSKFNPQEVDFLGSFTDGDASSQVFSMLKAVGAADNLDVIDKYFPRNAIAGHSSDTHGRARLYYRKPETAVGVYRLYEEDYTQMGLKKSALLEKAMRLVQE